LLNEITLTWDGQIPKRWAVTKVISFRRLEDPADELLEFGGKILTINCPRIGKTKTRRNSKKAGWLLMRLEGPKE
jgi:hypothetical protein